MNNQETPASLLTHRPEMAFLNDWLAPRSKHSEARANRARAKRMKRNKKRK